MKTAALALARRILVPAGGALVLALAAPAARAQSIIIHPPERTRPPVVVQPGATRLDLRSLVVETEIRGRVATTRIDEVFFNPSSRELEGTYLFPLPDGAAVERFSMFVDGTEVAGELLDAGRARGIYEAIVRQRRDPALLEFVGRRLFRASIFPIPPRSEKRVRLSYTELLSGDTGSTTWRFPLANCRHAGVPIRRAAISVSVAAERPLATVFSPTHRVDVVRKDERHARVSWEDADVLPDEDFTLIVQEPAGKLGFSFSAHRPAGEEGTFLLLVAPAVEPDEKPIPRDVVFCLDTSGSMAGEKIEQARNALRYAIRTLGAEDRFGIVTFATEPRRFREALVPATADVREAALAFVDGIEAVGGTAIDAALRSSLDYLEGGDAERPGVVLFVTDGLPTIGEREPARILAAARKRAGERVRLFAFGVGYDVNTFLVDRLAEDLRGARDYVAPKEDIEQKVSSLVAKTSHPVMTDVRVTVDGVAVHDLYPRRLPDLFRGSELALLGRYGGSGSAVIRVQGRVRGGAKEFVNEVVFPKSEEGASYLGRLWALRRVGHLMDEIRLHGETGELKSEVVRLAKRYGILTPYTSYLVLENEGMLARFNRDTGSVPPPGGRGGSAGGGGYSGPTGEADLDGLLEAARRRAREAEAPGESGPGFGVAGTPPPDGGGGTPTPPPVAKSPSGPRAVEESLDSLRLKDARAGEDVGGDGEKRESGKRTTIGDLVKQVAGRTFYLRDGVWFDATVDREAKRTRVAEFSDAYLALAAGNRTLALAFSLGRVVVKVGDVVYEVTP